MFMNKLSKATCFYNDNDFNTLQNLAIAFGVLSVGIFLIEWNIDEKGLDLPVRANIN